MRTKLDPQNINGQLFFNKGNVFSVFKKNWEALAEDDDNFPCINYLIRQQNSDIPRDNNVLYGLVDGKGHVVHLTELEEITDV
jgi:hypothetical protein